MSNNDYDDSCESTLDELINEALVDAFECFGEENIPGADEMEERDTASEYNDLANSFFVDGDYGTAFIYYLKAAAMGSNAAKQTLSNFYYYGQWGIGQDERKWFEWSMKALLHDR